MNGDIGTWPADVAIFFVIGLSVTAVAVQFVIVYTLDRFVFTPLLRRWRARRAS